MTNKGMKQAVVLLALAFGFLLPRTVWAQDAAAAAGTTPKDQAAEASDAVTNSVDAASTNETSEWSWRPGRVHRNALVSIGHDVELKEGETADAVVVIGGSAIVRGKVHGAAVAGAPEAPGTGGAAAGRSGGRGDRAFRDGEDGSCDSPLPDPLCRRYSPSCTDCAVLSRLGLPDLSD